MGVSRRVAAVGAGADAGVAGAAGGKPSDERAALLERLSKEVGDAAAYEEATMYRLLAAIRAFDEARGWQNGKHSSLAHWVAWRTNCGLGSARQKVRVARVLGRFPAMDEAMRSGRINFAQARAIARVITPENEAYLLSMADGRSSAEVEEACAQFRRLLEAEGVLQPDEASLYVRHWELDSGFVKVQAVMRKEAAALLVEAMDKEMRAMNDARVAPEGRPGLGGGKAPSKGAAGAEGGSGAAGGSGGEEPPVREPPAPPRYTRYHALVRIAEKSLAGSSEPSESRRPNYEIVVVAERDALEGKTNAPALLSDGTAIPVETARRLACDASRVEVTADADGNTLDVGRRTRSIPKPLQRALRLRDGGCRFPGCTHEAWVDSHHIQHWIDGGETKLPNLVLLCRTHHTAVHEGGFRVEHHGDELRFYDPQGKWMPNVWRTDGPLRPTLDEWLIETGAISRSTPVPAVDGHLRDWPLTLEALWTATFPQVRKAA